MNGESVIIIGAGLAGLATGCYARMNGYRTRIFEMNTAPGGVCTSWQRQSYTIDGDIHYLVDSRPGSLFYDLYEELGITQRTQLMTLSEFRSLMDEKTGRRLVITADLDRLAADMKALAPEDGDVIDEFIAGCRGARGFNWAPSPEFEFFKNYAMPVSEFARRIKEPFLRWCIPNMNDVPAQPLFSLFMVLGQLADGKLAMVAGGSLKLSLAVAQRYHNLEGEIACGAQVEEILVENDRAVGIRLADGSEHRADVIVSGADGYSTIFRMLGGRYTDQGICDRYHRWPLYHPINYISFGVASQLPVEPSPLMILLREPLDTGGRVVDFFKIRNFSYDPSLAPVGKTVIQVYTETDFDHWYRLQEERPFYEAAKAKLAEEVLGRLEAFYPGISSQVEMTDVATPYTLWRYTRNYRGAYEGWMFTLEAMMTTIPKTLPGLANFYMAGQWVQPGGGIPAALNSGRNVVQMICEQHGKH